VLSIFIIGGLGNLSGSYYASAFLVLLPEALRFVGMPDSIAANMRQIIVRTDSCSGNDDGEEWG